MTIGHFASTQALRFAEVASGRLKSIATRAARSAAAGEPEMLTSRRAPPPGSDASLPIHRLFAETAAPLRMAAGTSSIALSNARPMRPERPKIVMRSCCAFVIASIADGIEEALHTVQPGALTWTVIV